MQEASTGTGGMSPWGLPACVEHRRNKRKPQTLGKGGELTLSRFCSGEFCSLLSQMRDDSTVLRQDTAGMKWRCD